MKDLAYEMDAAQVEHALAILEREQKAHEFSRSQRIRYTLLRICAYGFVLTAVVALLVGFLGGVEGIWGGFLLGLLVLIVLLVVLTPIALLLNLPLFLKAWRQIRLARRFNFSEVFQTQWAARSKGSKFLDIATALGAIFGALIVLGAVWVVIESFVQEPAELLEPVAILTGAGTYVAMGLALVALYFMRLARERSKLLAEVVRVHHSLEQRVRGVAPDVRPETIPLPDQDFTSIAEIERAQIARERVNAIQKFEASDVDAYVVSMSHAVLRSRDSLDPDTKFRVDLAVEALMTDPRPATATRGEEGGTWHLPVPGTALDILYSVDEGTHRILVLSLSSPAEAGPISTPGGETDA